MPTTENYEVSDPAAGGGTSTDDRSNAGREVALPSSPRVTDRQLELLAKTVLQTANATADELAVFAQVCNRLGLDPFLKQIYAYRDKRSGVLIHIVGIDGLRLIAQRTGRYRGQTPIEWCGAEGEWRDVWLDSSPPWAARAGVYAAGYVEPLYTVVTLREFGKFSDSGDLRDQWATMPAQMLGIRAEAQALRRAFPAELSGIYAEGEVDVEDTPPPPSRPPAPAPANTRPPRSSGYQGGQGGRSSPPAKQPLDRAEYKQFMADVEAAGISREQLRALLDGRELGSMSRDAVLAVWDTVKKSIPIDGQALEVGANG